MFKSRKYFSMFLSFVFLIIVSCEFDAKVSTDKDSGVDFSQVIEKQELFEKKLNQIVKKLDNLKVSVDKMSSSSNKANNNKKSERPKRKPADPNYVHNIPQGDSFSMGNPNAAVTITYFFEFQ